MSSSFDRQLRPCCDVGHLCTPPPAAKADSSPFAPAAHVADSAPVRILKRMTVGDSLKVLLAHEDSADGRRLHDSLTRAESETICIRRALFLAGLLFVLCLAALAFCGLLLPNLSSNPAHFVILSLSLVCLASLISEVEFVGYGIWHHFSVNRLHQECHRLIRHLVGSRLRAPQDKSPVPPPVGTLLLFPPSTPEKHQQKEELRV